MFKMSCTCILTSYMEITSRALLSDEFAAKQTLLQGHNETRQ